MTKNEIRQALIEAIDNWETEIDEYQELIADENTDLTDVLAGVLEHSNPNHDYPPVPKP